MSATDPVNDSVKLWDWPIRLTHWSLAICVLACYGTAEWHWLDMQWHFYFGYAILVLCVFRVLWGLFGSEHARFASFVRTPRAIWQYLQGNYPKRLGHNPLGALSVLALIGALFVQTFTGLFNNDDIEWFGPLSEKISGDWQESMADIHERFYWVLFALIAVHVIAVLYYTLIKRDGLLRPMITGKKLGVDRSNPAMVDERQKPLWLAILLLLMSASLVWATIYFWPAAATLN
jgi:cytochrome b